MRENIPLLIAKKVLIFLVSVWLLSLAVFCMARLAPGDPLSAYYGERVEKMSVAEKAEARTKLGLDEPLLEQYGVWLKNALHGDFGISYKYKQPVMTVIAQRLGNTLLLGGLGFVLTFAGALGLGLLCAWYEDRWPDKLLCRVGTVLSCIPEFWLSMVLILIFCVTLGWLPAAALMPSAAPMTWVTASPISSCPWRWCCWATCGTTPTWCGAAFWRRSGPTTC